MAGMLTRYKGKPVVFYAKAPMDTDKGWKNGSFPRIDFNSTMLYDPERKTNGVLTVNIWCNTECEAMPEDIEKRLVELISGTFYTGERRATMCAVWNRSDDFSFETEKVGNNTPPEVFGITSLFDLTEFPAQLTTTPDPIQGANMWAKANFPDMRVAKSASG